MSTNKYDKGKIYTIRCRYDESLISVGSTIQPLCKRFACHKDTSKRYPNRLLYATINNDWDNWYIELHENWPCENREQLCKREGEVIREIGGTLNMRMAGRVRTFKEYYIDNKDKILERMKLYNTENVEKYKQYYKDYQTENVERIKLYQREYRLRKKSEKSENAGNEN